MRGLLLAACLAACGSGNRGTGDDAPGDASLDALGAIAPEMLVDALEASLCEVMVRCERVQDQATCDAANILLDNEMNALLAAIADGTVIYDAAAAQRCIDFIAMRGCTVSFHADDPCDDVFTGTVTSGGACIVDGQCANGGTCNQNDPNCDARTTCCPGTCAGTRVESPLNGPCDNGTHECSHDTYCDTSANVCAAVVTTEGAPCRELDQCADPMICNGASTGMGRCKTPAATGAACVRTDTLPCMDSRDYCDPGTLRCTRGAQPGQPCGNGVACIDWAKCIGNQCVADRKLNESCTTAPMAADCAGTLVCTGGSCQPPAAGLTCAL